MGEAVKSATDGIRNENSVLVDNAGVTKNLSVIWEEYAASIGKGVGSLNSGRKTPCHGRRSHAGNRVPDRRRGPLCLNFRRRAGGAESADKTALQCPWLNFRPGAAGGVAVPDRTG